MQQDRRFAAAQRVLHKVPPKLLEVISDDVTDELARAAERGDRVIVLIDDGGGRQMAAKEVARLSAFRPRVTVSVRSI